MSKLLIITQRDPFFIDSFLSELNCSNQITVLDLPNFNKGKIWSIKRAIDLYGLIGFLKLIIERIKISFGDRRKVDSIKIHNPSDMYYYIKKLDKGDFLLSLSAPGLIDTDQIPSGVNAINIHSGGLPKYAGMMPIFWQLFDGKKSITLTFHELAKNIDTGAIYLEKEIKFEESLFKTSVIVKKIAAKVFSNQFLTNRFKISRFQNAESHVLNKFPESKDISSLRKKIKFI